MRAELYIDPLSDGEPTDRVVTLACRCARTTLVFLGNGVGLPAAWLIRLAVERHRAEHPDCWCTVHLVRDQPERSAA